MSRFPLVPLPLRAPVASPSRRRALLGGLLAAAAATGLAGCDAGTPAAAPFRGIDITGAPYGSALALTDFNGQPRTLADYRGRVLVLFFGFVQCPDVCPTALARAAAVFQQLGAADAAQVQLLFVTVDPERDTPALLREYLGAFHPSFVALSGDAAQTAAAAAEFRVHYQKVPTGSSYTMDHTALTYLLDRQGRLRVALRHEQPAEDHVADLRRLLAERAA